MRTCLTCLSFCSFREDYYDEMEPDDQGFCHNGDSPYFGNEGAGAEISCDYYEQISIELKK